MTISHVIYLEFARLIVSRQWVTEVTIPGLSLSQEVIILLALQEVLDF